MEQNFAVVGQKVHKYDGHKKVTGEVEYSTDIVLPGMLQAKILRSPHPHARILNIDTSAASRLPGVKAILTGKDVPQVGFGAERDFSPQWGDQRILKTDKVRYVGDEVAAVAATDEETALEALSLIRVDYEELPGVFDPEAAMLPGAPQIHAGIKNNISIFFPLMFGDTANGMKGADYIIEDKFTTQMVNQCTMGPRCIVSQFDHSGNLKVWRDTQFPYPFRAELSHVLGIPASKINIVRTAVGGGFGSKIDMQPFDPISVLLAKETGRPVKLEYTREEEFIAGHPRHPFAFYLKTGVKKDGTLVGREVKCIVDNGAYNALGPLVPLVAMHAFVGLYRVPYVKYDAYVVYTNKSFGSAFRGFGNPQGTFAVESHMDMIAEKIGMDPLELRLKNANQPNTGTINGLKITSCGLTECLQKAADSGGWAEKRKQNSSQVKKRGIGMASLIHVAGGARVFGLPGAGLSDGTGAIVKVDDFGKVVVLSGATDIGEGADTIQAQIVAETLGVRYEDVVLHGPDTESTPFDLGCHASRTTFCAGNAVKLAALDAKRQILKLAAEHLGVPADQLDIRNRQVLVKEKPEKGLPLTEVLQKAHYDLQGKIVIGTAYYEPPNGITDPQTVTGNMSATYAFGTHVAEVEVDTETGQVQVVNFVAAHDVGKVLNPLGLEGQMQGGVAQGIGYSLTEEVVFDQGKIVNPHFLDYKILTALDMPTVKTINVETIDPEGPFGAKGVAEPGLVPTAAAIANAVYNAVGVRIKDLPITPEKVLQAIEEEAGHNKLFSRNFT